MPKRPSLRDPDPDAEWEVWYRDTFDLECPPRVDVNGRALARGLMELWARYLFETVRPGGSKGFSRFHLRWNQTRIINIEGDWKGATRLREWVFGTEKHSQKGYVEEGDVRLLGKIAVAHANLSLADQSCEQILATAARVAGRKGFEKWLSGLADR